MRLRMSAVLLALMMLPGVQVLAEEEDKSAAQDQAVEAKADKKDAEQEKDKPDPIKRLAEMTLDRNVVPAKALNIAFPGKTKTMREVLEKWEEWGEEEKIGAVMLNITDLNLSMPDIEELRGGLERLKEQGKTIMVYFNGAGP